MLRTRLVGDKDRRGRCEGSSPGSLSSQHRPRYLLTLQLDQSTRGGMRTEHGSAHFQAEVLTKDSAVTATRATTATNPKAIQKPDGMQSPTTT